MWDPHVTPDPKFVRHATCPAHLSPQTQNPQSGRWSHPAGARAPRRRETPRLHSPPARDQKAAPHLHPTPRHTRPLFPHQFLVLLDCWAAPASMSGVQDVAEGSGNLILSELPKGMKRCVFIFEIVDESVRFMVLVFMVGFPDFVCSCKCW